MFAWHNIALHRDTTVRLECTIKDPETNIAMALPRLMNVCWQAIQNKVSAVINTVVLCSVFVLAKCFCKALH